MNREQRKRLTASGIRVGTFDAMPVCATGVGEYYRRRNSFARQRLKLPGHFSEPSGGMRRPRQLECRHAGTGPRLASLCPYAVVA